MTARYDSANIQALNGTFSGNNLTVLPLQLQAGEGKAGEVKMQDDVMAVTTTMLGTVYNALHMCRFPTTAKLKALTFASDAAMDTNMTATLAFDVTIGFSDSKIDGTPSPVQGQVFDSALDGGTASDQASSGRSKLFAAALNLGTKFGAAVAPTDILFTNLIAGTSGAFTFADSEVPAWSIGGFVDGQGYAQDPGGWFDIVFTVGVVAATAQAANIYTRLTFVE